MVVVLFLILQKGKKLEQVHYLVEQHKNERRGLPEDRLIFLKQRIQLVHRLLAVHLLRDLLEHTVLHLDELPRRKPLQDLLLQLAHPNVVEHLQDEL